MKNEDLECYWFNDFNTGDFRYFAEDTSNLLYKNDDFIRDHNYSGAPGVDPTTFYVILSNKSDGKILEKRIIPVQYEPYTLLSINDGIRTEVRDNKGKISQLEQTAEEFRFDIYDVEGSIRSEIQQTADSIMQRVDENYTELSNRGFVINANTEIFGSLTLNDED